MNEDYININIITPMTKFSKILGERILKNNKTRKPFCEPCARLEFRDKYDELEKESERRHGFVNFEDMKIDWDNLKLDRYDDEANFELIEDQEDVQDKVIEGSRTQVVIGHTLSYKCKKRGHGISVFIPIAE